jgi:hypothetical protein
MSGDSFLRVPRDFSLVLGWPIFQLLRRSHLTNDALELVHHRIIVISLFSWLPLLVLSALEGRMLGDCRTLLAGRGSSRPLLSRDTALD